MNTATFNSTVTFYVETCCNCSIQFAMPMDMQNRLRRSGGNFYCPNGHCLHYGDTTEDKLRRELDATQSKLSNAQFELIVASKKVKRLEKKAKNGVCPCCHRQFVQLSRHMKTKHPDFGE